MRLMPIAVGLAVVATFLGCSGPVRRQAECPDPLPKNEAKALVSRASQHLGEPYHYGGLSRKGWDCSGFVRYIYRNVLGVDLPRTARDMFYNGVPLPLSKGRAGDLVFFNMAAKRPSHVGIYLGRKQFIHVSKSDGVVISSLQEEYYHRHFLGLRRISFEQVASALK